MLFVIKKKQSLLFVVKIKQHKNKKSGNNPQTANQLMVCICGPSLCTHAPEEDSGLPGIGM